MENLTNLGVEPFYAYTKFNDRGAALRRQRLGIYTSQNNKQVEVLLPLGEVALYVTRAGWASFYQIVDTRKADHFHFVLNPAGHLKIRVLDKEGNPQPGVRADWVNPTAPLSISGATTAENGELRADSLVPGIFQVTISGFGGYRIEVQGGSETEVILQEGKAPAISLSKFHPTPAARPPASTYASPSSGENSRAKTMKKP